LLNKTVLKDVSEPLTSYALGLVMREWQETKKHGERIAEGEEAVEFDRESGCRLDYEPSTHYDLPCRHWMLVAIEPRCQLPPSLFHPKWSLDGPVVIYEPWKVSCQDIPTLRPVPTVTATADRFQQ
jgi:hypothetical protein